MTRVSTPHGPRVSDTTAEPLKSLLGDAPSCDCRGSGLVVSGNIFDREPVSFTLCSCAVPSIAAQRELRSLRARWDALVSEHAIDEAYDEMSGRALSKTQVARGLEAARAAALHVGDGDTTSFLDSEAQKRIAELEQQLADMRIGRGRLAAILHQGHHCGRTGGRCCNSLCQGEWTTGCYCCHHPRFALSSHDHDALAAFAEKEQRHG